MLERLERAWRVLATALCFTAFGAGGLVLGLLVFPVVALTVRDPKRRTVVARTVIHHLFRMFVGLMRLPGILTMETHGLERLRSGGQLILANHPTLIDVVLLMSLVRQSGCIVKGALIRNPFTRGPVRAAGYVCNDSSEGMIEDCVNSVHAGDNLIIFPEGTRTRETGPMQLHRGAARVAVHGRVDITPVHILCQPRMLAKGVKWYSVPVRRSHFRIEVGEPIAVAQFVDGAASHAVAARRLNRHLTDYFSREHGLASA
jgi:1-acyl-sn-glycerol-3-phosphate acyltransferase